MIGPEGMTAPRYKLRVYKSEAKGTQSIRIGQDESEFCIGVDFMGVAGDMPENVVAQLARELGKVLHRHLELKARGTSRIVVPQTGDIAMLGAKGKNGFAHK